MPRFVRFYLLACIALAYGYFALHAGEPLRLNVGDAWTDADVIASIKHIEHHGFGGADDLAQLIYGAIGRLLGTHEIAVFRAIAIAFSALAAWLLFQYARRMWNATIALIATALWTTSFLWLSFADSLHRAPIMHAACFLALWGVVRVVETGRRRHFAAALIGTFACLFTATNQWLFLPLGVLFTVYGKRGALLAGGTWRVIAACAAGGLLALALRLLVAPDPVDWQVALDRRVSAIFATLARRYTVLLTPLVWIPLAAALWRAVRAPRWNAALADGTTWLLVSALGSALLWPRAESASLRAQVLLPLYAIGSAMLIAQLFEGRRLRPVLGTAWCVAAPLWGFWLMVSQPREVLARDDVARVAEYFANNDRNDFVLSNLLADGPITTAFGRHGWPAPHGEDPTTAHIAMLGIFELTGTDSVHAILFTTPGSRLVDRSLPQIIGRRMGSIDGWPQLVPAKADRLIARYDQHVRQNLEAVAATRVLALSNFDVYRIDRTAMLDALARSLPVAGTIDVARASSTRRALLGWPEQVTPDLPTMSTIAGFGRCGNPIIDGVPFAPNRCPVGTTKAGIQVRDTVGISRAELLVRLARACDVELTITFGGPAVVDVAFNDTRVLACGDPRWGARSVTLRVPQRAVRAGANVIALDDMQPEPKRARPRVESIAIAPLCGPAE